MPNKIQLYADGDDGELRFGALDTKKGSTYVGGTIKL